MLPLLAFIPLLLFTAPVESEAATVAVQASPESASPPAVFLDCQSRRNCNRSQFQTEIEFATWVRDRSDADVHLIFTSQGLSGGGREYTLDFVGQGPLEGLTDELTFIEDGQDVQAEVMDGLARTLRLGLLRFALQSGMGENLDVEFLGDAAPEAGGDVESHALEEGEAGVYDPWNYWTFQVGLSGNADFRETRTSTRVNPRVNADRVTEDWKMNFHGRLDFRRESRDLADGRVVRDDRDDWRVTALVVRSVSNHFSVGIDADMRNSVARNQHARLQFNPAVEYNYFPYAEANRRQLIAHYSVGFEHSNYIEETMFGTLRETLPQHRLGVQYRAREQWGNAGLGIDANQYLHDADFYSLGIQGDVSYRIVRGLELNVSGSASIVNDNIHTPAGDISDEDILLGRQALPSSYRYQTSLGLSYRWGSSFANVVNTRFPRSVR
ncbi:MAG: hypothetical protein EA351_13885 [Gemmatimonadales bacterium]|nr:MAG: hypothetical protein EA351_13885 [Gemmatimonadales bacterium]